MRDPPLCHERFRMCGAGRTLFRILPPQPVSVHTAHKGQKRMVFRLLFPRGDMGGNWRWRSRRNKFRILIGACVKTEEEQTSKDNQHIRGILD